MQIIRQEKYYECGNTYPLNAQMNNCNRIVTSMQYACNINVIPLQTKSHRTSQHRT